MTPTETAGGTQAERNALAWQRTAGAALAGSAALLRLNAERLGGLAVVCTLATLPVAGWLLWEGWGRHGALRRGVSLRGGRALLSLCVLVAAMGAVELLALLQP